VEILDRKHRLQMNAIKIGRKDIIVYLMAINLIFTFVLMFKANLTASVETQVSSAPHIDLSSITARISKVQETIGLLKQEMSKKKNQVDIRQVESGLSQLSENINKMASENEMRLKAHLNQISMNSDKLYKKVIGSVESLNKSSSSQFISADNLPFTVLAIDSIQEQGVVDVSYSYKNIPLERGDVLAGWQVNKIDYGHQQVVFENKDHNKIKVNLNKGGK
jgi:hypothetical protein